ncbi:MAG TPA: PEGA domain-containing protein [Vicinamibacterales bacterium]
MEPARATSPQPTAVVFHDGLGERRRVSDTTVSDTLELLCLRRELTSIPSFEFALRERASRLANFRHTYFARVKSVERLSDATATLAIASESTRGIRLSNLLTPTPQRPVAVDINASLHLIRQLVSAVAMLHESGGDLAHGAIGPERIIVTPNARVVIAEYVLGAALEQLRWSPERYWRELRVALPPSDETPRFDQRTDVTQIGVVGLSLILGRLLTENEYPSAIHGALSSAWAISSRGGLEPLPPGLRSWLGRALQLDPRHSFASALEARAELDRVLSGEDEDSEEDAAAAVEAPQSVSASASVEPTIQQHAASEPLVEEVEDEPQPEVSYSHHRDDGDDEERYSTSLHRGTAADDSIELTSHDEPLSDDHHLDRPAVVEHAPSAVGDHHLSPIFETSFSSLAEEVLAPSSFSEPFAVSPAPVPLAAPPVPAPSSFSLGSSWSSASSMVPSDAESDHIAPAPGFVAAELTPSSVKWQAPPMLADPAPVAPVLTPPAPIVSAKIVSAPIVPVPIAPAPVPVTAQTYTPASSIVSLPPVAAAVPATPSPRVPLPPSLPAVEPFEFKAEPERPMAMSQVPTRRTGFFATVAIGVLVVSVGAVFGARRYFSAAAAPAPTGQLSISSTPTGAAVVVDGSSQGVTPVVLTLTPGAHLVELRGAGEPRTLPITMTAGAQMSQYVELPGGAAPKLGQLQVRTEPAGAQVNVDGVARGRSPVLVSELTPGQHNVIVESELGTVRQSVAVEAGSTAALVVPLGAPEGGAPVSGWISVAAPVDLQIFENKRLLGTSQSDRIMVAAGRHDIEIVNEPLGYRVVRTIQVAPGKVAPIKLEWPNGTIALNAVPWAEVWIDGNKVGETPIGNLSLPIGPHEVVFRHPDLGEQRHAATVSATTPARLSVDLRRKP